MDDLQQKLSEIQERNQRVEANKAWETSLTRRAFISIITYIVALLWLYIIHEQGIWLKAVIPVAGFVLSTLSLPALKKVWVKRWGK